ncbi:MAG: peptide ABC transporter substrate-binding protein [Candidatus Eremiobacteraeota bacterium]|nr:peptide ABC transporter substrate-binding protein [Candidatus Eremiobacteraeota bacterium]MBC5801550.1 peptide ABC transporter substrate-binding protein [Candidatus Eremiobacteraeota bacterium]MBC5822821.1 peptide ABC transporter substrate-binding protein [Candidatus Eremiobacteraeota bacterium]
MLLLVACAPGCTRAPGGPAGARLIVAQAQEPNSLNPLFMTGPTVAGVAPLIYSGLVTIDEHGRIRPQLATSVPSLRNGGISRDGLTITYRLRSGVRWQDGAPLTAADVAFTYAAIMNPKNNVPSRFGYETIRNVEAVGDRIVRVHLRQRYAPILSLFMGPDQNFSVLPRHLLASYRDLNAAAFNEMPVGSGPFRVVAWAHGDRLRLVRNAAYFGGTPQIAEIDLKFVPDSSAVLNQLRTREVGAAFFADPSFLDAYGRLPKSRVVRVPQNGFGDLLFNTQAPAVSDARVRRALIESLDIPRLVHNATKGAQTAKDAGRGLFTWAYDPAIAPPRYDPPDAARLFALTGWHRGPDGVLRENGRALALDLAFPSGTGVASAIAVDLQQELRTAGVMLTLRAYTPTLFRAPAAAGGPLFGGKFALAFFEPFGVSDPDTHWYLGCSEIPPHGFNAQRFCDPAIERALALGASSYDPAIRRRSAVLVQQRVAAELPFVPLYQTNAVDVFPNDLHGFRSSALSPFWNVADWTLSR